MKEAISRIEEEYDSNGRRMIEMLRNETDEVMKSPEQVREPLADYLEYLYEEEEETGEIPTDEEIEATFNLTWRQRIRALLTGQVKTPVTVFVNTGLVFGIDWQTEDIINLLGDE